MTEIYSLEIKTIGIQKVQKDLKNITDMLKQVQDIVNDLKSKGVSLDISVEVKKDNPKKVNVKYALK